MIESRIFTLIKSNVSDAIKKKYPDFNVTATFFVTGALFNQGEYNEKILKLIEICKTRNKPINDSG